MEDAAYGWFGSRQLQHNTESLGRICTNYVTVNAQICTALRDGGWLRAMRRNDGLLSLIVRQKTVVTVHVVNPNPAMHANVYTVGHFYWHCSCQFMTVDVDHMPATCKMSSFEIHRFRTYNLAAMWQLRFRTFLTKSSPVDVVSANRTTGVLSYLTHALLLLVKVVMFNRWSTTNIKSRVCNRPSSHVTGALKTDCEEDTVYSWMWAQRVRSPWQPYDDRRSMTSIYTEWNVDLTCDEIM